MPQLARAVVGNGQGWESGPSSTRQVGTRQVRLGNGWVRARPTLRRGIICRGTDLDCDIQLTPLMGLCEGLPTNEDKTAWPIVLRSINQ